MCILLNCNMMMREPIIFQNNLWRDEDYIKIKKDISISILHFDTLQSSESKDGVFKINNQIIGMFDAKPAVFKAPFLLPQKQKSI
jgi:hypothetical protein